jgi:hypothetical protein
MTVLTKQIQQAREAYGTDGKAAARRAVIAVAQDMQASTVLELYGDGQSARAFRAELPDAAVVSAEKDSRLWARLMVEAQTLGFGYVLGDVRKAPGTYDLIWLDLMGPVSRQMRDLLHSTKTKLNSDGLLALTVMPARETDVIFTGEERERFIPMWLQAVTGLKVHFLFPYRRGRGQWMWLLFLQRSSANLWSDTPSAWFKEEGSIEDVLRQLHEEGYFEFGLPGWSRQAHALYDAMEGYFIATEHPFWTPKPRRSMLRPQRP